MSFEVITHKGDHQPIPVNVRDDDLAPIVSRAKGLLHTMQSGVFLPAEPGPWLCGPKWCGYWHSCSFIPNYKKCARSNAA